MARRAMKTPPLTATRGPNDGPEPVPTLRATSKNQTHPYFLAHDGPVSDNAAWTVKELCAAYDWPKPNDAAGGGTIALIHLSGGWLEDDIKKFFAAQGLAGMEPDVSDHPVDGEPNNSNSSSPNVADTEVALDIQIAGAAYAVATGKPATIRIYWTSDLTAGLRAATTDECDVCCITWGADEQSWGRPAADIFNAAAKEAAANGMIIVAASGDNDSSDGGPTPANVDFPASSPYVIGCGGTSRRKAPKSGEPIETVWNNNRGHADGQGTGGGFSEFFPIPDWQLGTVQARRRMVPDVAAHADPQTGYKIFAHGSELTVGGTSAAAALYAGLFAAFGSKRGFITPELYKNQVCFNDITDGDNGKFRALVGPDPCTGLGSPRGTRLAQRIGSDAATLARVRRQLNESSAPCVCQSTEYSGSIPPLTPRVSSAGAPAPYRCAPTPDGGWLKWLYDPASQTYSGGPVQPGPGECPILTPRAAIAPYKCVPTPDGRWLKWYYDPSTRTYSGGPDIVDRSEC
jgi:kumamolisin